MKILCIGRNYADHIAELHNEIPDEPVIFLKPDTALLKNNDSFYYPDFTQDIHHELEIILRISKEGKNIQPQFAGNYFDAIGLGIDFTARDLQSKAKSKGLPWDLAKGFNGSAPVSEFLPLTDYPDLKNISFTLRLNQEIKQQGNTSLMLHPFENIISYISRFILLKKGDIIFTGTPKGVGPVQVGDRLEAFLEDQKVLDFEIK
ncbi:fumarylacetoacetate hydrolase family protein [Adhaeribacter pallidiroseus]|uniref:5-carboxymethyl-2-hydroxymuconate Delta-isomerase n=1 Tax=Adhaeribacter pallidiroseus TaxID=2072847 RepID=A0A369QKJ2_9BACT|nr:fumarylacetoacetate hydrolase family protein [Adhaeribacter pallidiroseus]RDC64165.1 5-carboxymethyl-2-hydroxymuconate Delta-isomerase [Adhaeribacter pallidiroseus]